MTPCKLCGSATIPLGTKAGRISNRIFHLHRCLDCHFAFVADPWTDYGTIYSEDYYRGLGADPYIDYLYELEHPHTTIRTYEWRGILANVQALIQIRPDTRWLDFGCGQGGLLDYCQKRIAASYTGFEEGWVRPDSRELRFPIVRKTGDLRDAGQFDVITAIEVFEHVENPKEAVALLRRLLKPGGLLFLTTGNPVPHWNRFLEWEYVYPEIHVSYFAPATMDRLLTETGFRTEFRGYLPGFSDVIRYKVLKRLGIKDQRGWEKTLPWPLISRAINTHLKITAYPVAWI